MVSLARVLCKHQQILLGWVYVGSVRAPSAFGVVHLINAPSMCVRIECSDVWQLHFRSHDEGEFWRFEEWVNIHIIDKISKRNVAYVQDEYPPDNDMFPVPHPHLY